ncbi:protein kinase domain-containing protein [Marinactinospora thermotolerans]|uniref:Serine/threonine protein kinase n=1 Tax=Marinactinospora thermotolerans DSM 45154 TaxID=1122192 RepID=A0A1T4SZ71_9ACTN|nr:protein kinase [Marinactinospora thermotolerans]SKA33495.1 Serine/threonine protein kinase [Marinactinospora thermotolerans DSM 45154]
MPSDGLPKNLEPLAAGDPATIGPYVLAGRLGSGGMGTVYLGRAPEKGAQVAIKVIRPELAFDEATRARFRDEMENARRVASFCTAKVLDHGTFENRPYMVTEYIAGTALAEHIATHGPLDSSTLHGFALGVAAALAAIHGAGLVHRDLKPANVLLSLSGPRVIDFGIARALNTATNHTQTGIVMGSPGWMAPEQLLEEKVTTAADIFAWGCLVAFAGTATHPFGNGDAMTLGKRVLFAEPQINGLDSPLDRLVAQALAKEPERRPKAQDLLLALAGGGGNTEDSGDANDMVSHALHQSWRPNLPPIPPMPPQQHQGAPGPHQGGGPRHPQQPAPLPGQAPQHAPSYPGHPGPPGAAPQGAHQGRQMGHLGAPGPAPQRPAHHTGQFPTAGPQHGGAGASSGTQHPAPARGPSGARPQAQPYVPPVPPPPRAPAQPAGRRNRWLIVVAVTAVVLLIALFALLTALGANGLSWPWQDNASSSGQEAPSADGPAEDGDGADPAPRFSGSDGTLNFTVLDYRCGTGIGGRPQFPERTYCVFPVQVRNLTTQTVEIQPEWNRLFDSESMEYLATDPTPEEADQSLWGRIGPGETAEGEIVFAMAADTQPSVLILHGRETSEGARIRLATTPAGEPA